MHFGWSHIAGRALVASLVIELASGLSAFAQQPDTRDYESEEDLWEALREGELSYDDYLELLETSRLGTDDELVPASDWEGLPGSDAGYLTGPDTTESIAQGESSPTRHPHTARWSFRSGYNGDLGEQTGGDGYTTARFRNSNFAGLLDWRHDGTSGSWQRRLLEWRTDHLRVQAGNVEPRLGRGLVVGRRSRLIGATQSNRPEGDWWQPTRSRFNGLWLSAGDTTAIAGDIVTSDIRSSQLTERMAAMQLVAGSRLFRLGLTGLAGEIRDRDSSGLYTERVLGGHVRIGEKDRQLLAEIALAHGGATATAAEAVWRFEGGRFHGIAWSYSRDFVNPWGGGPGHSDLRKVTLKGIDETYASRTAGERGFSLATRIDPHPDILGGQASANWEWMTHREAPDQAVQHAWAVRVLWKRGRLTLRPFARGAVDSIQTSRSGIGSSIDYGTPDRHLTVRVESGRHNVGSTRYLRAGLGAKWWLSQAVRLEPAVRWVDPDLDRPADGYWYLYFTETIFPASVVRIQAALVWQRYERRGQGDMVELRIRMVAGKV